MNFDHTAVDKLMRNLSGRRNDHKAEPSIHNPPYCRSRELLQASPGRWKRKREIIGRMNHKYTFAFETKAFFSLRQLGLIAFEDLPDLLLVESSLFGKYCAYVPVLLCPLHTTSPKRC